MTAPRIFIPRPASTPTIYAYSLPELPTHKGYLKIGYTGRNVALRLRESTVTLALNPKLLLKESALRPDGSTFSDHDVHELLIRAGFPRKGREWFRCKVDDVRSAILAVRNRTYTLTERTESFKMRAEQYAAVKKTCDYFRNSEIRPPRFLWNAKMRFGKTFAAYQLCRRMGFKKILVLTFKPAVESSWSDDIFRHIDFEGWQFISNHTAQSQGLRIDDEFERCDRDRPLVVFGSFQDLLGTNENGGIKAKNEFIHTVNWDIVILDEYHFGAWRESSKRLFAPDDERDADIDPEACAKSGSSCDESVLPITADHYLYMSGTPFRALNSGEFIEEQIFSWTYSDEQKSKAKWRGSKNPYASMPRMILMTYQIPESIKRVASQGEHDEFDLNVFFSVQDGRFVYESEVRNWLLMIRGAYHDGETIRLGRKPPMPYSDSRLLGVLSHTLWYLPNVASCHAMKDMLESDAFFRDYRVVLCAGSECGNGLDALPPVLEAMNDPLESRTITLSCGKLTTGVTVRAWSGVFMLRNLQSPESYFQAAFRVQSSWTTLDDNGDEIILKPECWVFDFAIDRALKQIADYSCRLNVKDSDPERKIEEFMRFLPVLAYDGSSMKQIDAQDVLDFTLSGTSATLLARRWESALLVNVDNETLKRLMGDASVMDALMRIESLRALNRDIETIINKSEHVNSLRKGNTPAKKKEITQEERDYKSKREEVRDKLRKFVARVPLFMYLTDERERTLEDVIRDVAPSLFRRVTGIDTSDFDKLCKLGVFNSDLINDAIYKFKRYEDSSLGYTGLEKNITERIGGFDETKARTEFYNQDTQGGKE